MDYKIYLWPGSRFLKLIFLNEELVDFDRKEIQAFLKDDVITYSCNKGVI
jgi:hypothetical protein